VLKSQGKLDEAATQFERMVALDPGWARSHIELGQLRQLQGRIDDAVREFMAAVRSEPNSPEARRLLADALVDNGEFAKAREQLDLLRVREPASTDWLVKLGRLLWLEGKPREALVPLEQALAKDAALAEAWNYKGLVLESLTRPDDAIASFKRAVRLAADEPLYHVHLAHAQYDAGNRAEAAQQFSTASRLHRDWPQALLAQAWLQATHPESRRRNGVQALRKATTVCQATDYRVPEALDVLAAAHAEVGQFDRAVEQARTALKLLPPDSDDAKAIQERLRLYEQKKAYREESSGR
jgi:tetratricopeptide (TPR) repeat protein